MLQYGLRVIVAACYLAAAFFPILDKTHPVAADESVAFGPETFTRSQRNKDLFTRTFAATDVSVPYTLTVVNGDSDGSHRVRKGWITLNGEEIVTPRALNQRIGRFSAAIRPRSQNEITIKVKGGAAGSFIRITVEPARSSLLADPFSVAFDIDQTGIGTPFGVTVNQAAHRAFVTDRYWDSVIEFDVESSSVIRWFNGIDGDLINGNGATSAVCYNASAETVLAINGGDDRVSGASLSDINLSLGEVRQFALRYNGRSMNSLNLALNQANNVAAFDGLYSNGGRAYFIDLGTKSIVTRQEDLYLGAPVFHAKGDRFVFSASGDDASRPALYSYRATAPFDRTGRIQSTAPPGTRFEKLAINQNSELLVAVNQRDGSVYLFDLAAGIEVARIPAAMGTATHASADVAVNPRTNMAVVVSGFMERIVVIDLETQLVAAEIPLPPGTLPLGVDVDHELNRAVVAEHGLGTTRRNGSILVIQLPDR